MKIMFQNQYLKNWKKNRNNRLENKVTNDKGGDAMKEMIDEHVRLYSVPQ